jgi:long-chain acyl-CoA synthetase
MNVANFVDRAARNVPVQPAVGDGTELLTYGDFAAETDATAASFADLGVEPGDRVAVALDNGVPFLLAYFGAMKGGAVPVPVNTQFNVPQARYVVDTSDAVAMVTDDAFAELAAELDVAVTVDGSVGHEFAAMRRDAPDDYDVHPRRSDELAAVVYTSGTTGRPKGVRHTHGNLHANAVAMGEYFELSRSDVTLTVCQCFHVTGLNVTTTPAIVAGAENRLLPEWDPETTLQAIETHGVTCAFFTPSMLIDLLDCDAVDRYDRSSLEVVGVGGAPMPTGRFDDAERLLGCPVLEGYGMTETAPVAAFNRLDAERKPGSVGPPARDVVDLRVEDLETGDPVDPGERGELLWRGDTVTPGYERPENERAAFVERAGERWLRSGDVGFLDDDGHLFVVDRRADMFTTGCANVFPREIEDVLYDLEGVAGAAVVDARDDRRGAVVTAVVRRTDDSLTADQIREVCTERLEEHEVPQRVEFVDEIPTTATGKVDRATLRDVVGDAPTH